MTVFNGTPHTLRVFARNKAEPNWFQKFFGMPAAETLVMVVSLAPGAYFEVDAYMGKFLLEFDGASQVAVRLPFKVVA